MKYGVAALLAGFVVAIVGHFAIEHWAPYDPEIEPISHSIEDWSTSAGSNNSAAPDGAPEGWAPSSVNNWGRETMAQVRRWAEQSVFGHYATASGTQTAYRMTPDIKPSAYTPGALYWFVANTTNTGAATLDIASLGTKNINLGDGALVGGEIIENIGYIVMFDGDDNEFEIVSRTTHFNRSVNIHVSDSSQTAPSATDDLVIEGTGDVGASLIAGNASNAAIGFHDTDGQNRGRIQYQHPTDAFQFIIGGGGAAYWTGSGLMIGTAVTPEGVVTANQGTADGVNVSVQSSDIAHGFTDEAETDSYGILKKSNATEGGLEITGIAEDTTTNEAALILEGIGLEADNSANSTSSRALVEIYAAQHDGANAFDNIQADSNVWAVRARRGGAYETVLVLDEDGDLAVLGSGSLGTFDHHDDIALLAGFRGSLMTPEMAREYGLAEFIEYARPVLEESGIVAYNEDGNHFVDLKGVTALLIDAVRQQAAKQANEIDALRAEIRALRSEIRREPDIAVLH